MTRRERCRLQRAGRALVRTGAARSRPGMTAAITALTVEVAADSETLSHPGTI